MDPYLQDIVGSTGKGPIPDFPQRLLPTRENPENFAAPTQGRAMQNNLRTALTLDDPESFVSKVRNVLEKLSGVEGLGGPMGKAILAGLKARGAPTSNMAIANRILEAPNARMTDNALQDIWKRLSVAPGKEGGMRWEIRDDAARINPNWAAGEGHLPDVLRHPQLYNAYPHLKELPVIHRLSPELSGAYWPPHMAPGRVPFIEATASDPKQLLDILLHETQHGIQSFERFPTGGNPLGIANTLSRKDVDNYLRKRVTELVTEMKMSPAEAHDTIMREYTPSTPANFLRSVKEEIGHNRYLRRAGEVEARNVEARRRDPDLYNFSPAITEDIERGSQIITRDK